mgnify:CR=1 FL=1
MKVYIRHSSIRNINGVFKKISNEMFHNRIQNLYFRKYEQKYVISKKPNELINFIGYYDIDTKTMMVYDKGLYKVDLGCKVEFEENIQTYPATTQLKKMNLQMFCKDSKMTQGQSGNCWLISTLIALEKHITFCEKKNIIYLVTTEKGTVKFNKLIEKLDENNYKVFLKIDGILKEILIDNEIPHHKGDALYCNATCSWPLLIEKAFFKQFGYKALNSSYPEYALSILNYNFDEYPLYLCKNTDKRWLVFNGPNTHIDIDLKVLKLGFSDFHYTNEDILKIIKMKIENKIVIVSINSSRKLPIRCDICKKFKHNHTYCVQGIEGNKVLIRDPVLLDIIFLDFFKFLDIFNCISLF